MSILESSLKVKNLELKNRLIFPPMGTGMAEPDGKVNEKLIQYYDDRARGAYLSMIIVEHSFVSQEGKASERQLSAAEDSTIEGLRKIAETIQKNGVKAVLQINHAGASASRKITGCPIVSASPIAGRNSCETAHSLSEAEIKKIVSDFADAAERGKKAGFDGIEIHSAHSYLLNQFYSPYFNSRKDAYGEDLSGRIKIHLEIIKAARERLGEAYPLFLRLGACDYEEKGTTVEDSIAAAQEFEKAGIDVLDISGGAHGYQIPGHREEGWFADITAQIKPHISIPVILTGGIRSLSKAEEFLADGAADLIGVGRPIFKDSLWAKKAFEGQGK